MTAKDAFNLTTGSGSDDLAAVIALCKKYGQYCLIGGLAVNCFVEPVYTLDADLILTISDNRPFFDELSALGFKTESFPHSVNAQFPGSELRVQFTTDQRYSSFPMRAEEREVLGIRMMVASLPDIIQGKIWAYTDPQRRLTKRKKDELDLLRLGEKFADLKSMMPEEIRKQLGS